MKNIIITIFFLFIAGSLSAQLYIGPKLGLATSFDEAYNDDSYNNSTTLSQNIVPSVNIGAVLLYHIGVLSIRWEPMYIELRGKLNMRDMYKRYYILEQKRTYWRNNFLLDVGTEIKNRVRLFGQAGLTMGFLLNSERVIDGEHYFPYKNLKQFDIGITIGLGALIRIKKNWIELNVRANQAVTAYKYIPSGWFGSYYYNSNLSYNIAYVFLISNENKKTNKKEAKLFY
jgi:hypothetical protein